eukprot:10798187-Lingulodinium_polyedra.AAC.1
MRLRGKHCARERHVGESWHELARERACDRNPHKNPNMGENLGAMANYARGRLGARGSSGQNAHPQ